MADDKPQTYDHTGLAKDYTVFLEGLKAQGWSLSEIGDFLIEQGIELRLEAERQADREMER